MRSLKPIDRHVWQTEVRSFDVDKTLRLTFAAQMRLQQEAGERHMREVGFPYAVMREELSACFILTRLSARVYRRPVLGEAITVATWCRGLFGAQYLRCYRITAQNGEMLTDAMATVAAVNADTRRILRPDKVPVFSQFLFRDEESTAPMPDKITPQAEPAYAAARRVCYSDIDFNAHMNNTVYAALLCDYLPGGMYDREADAFAINFKGEITEGEEIVLKTAAWENNAFVSGETQNGVCFSGRCTFADY